MNVLITGGTGFLGRHLHAALAGRRGIGHIACVGSKQADLTNPSEAKAMFKSIHPDTVFHLAAVCGGIGANRLKPLKFLMDNARIGLNVVEACLEASVKRLVAVGTVCAYPKFTPIPFKESDLWNGYPEETNAPYGIAKRLLGEACRIAEGHGLSCAFALPANLYGPGDNFDPTTSHVIPAIIRTMWESRHLGEVTLWGTGFPTRDFLYAPDCAEALIALAESDMAGPVNIGTGVETSINRLALDIAYVMSFWGPIYWDSSKPDGQPRRVLDTSKMDAIWKPRHSLIEGLRKTVEWWEENR